MKLKLKREREKKKKKKCTIMLDFREARRRRMWSMSRRKLEKINNRARKGEKGSCCVCVCVCVCLC